MTHGWALALTLWVALTGASVLQRRVRALAPLTWFLLSFAVMFLIRPLPMMLAGDYSDLERLTGQLEYGVVLLTWSCIVAGLLCFCVGYVMAVRADPGRRVRLPRLPWRPLHVTAMALLFIGLNALVMYKFRSSVFGHVGDVSTREYAAGGSIAFTGMTAYVFLFPRSVMGVVLALAAYYGVRWWVYVAWLASALLLYDLYLGFSRWTIVFSLLALALVQVARSRRRRLLWAMALISPVALGLFTEIGERRARYRAHVQYQRSLGEVFSDRLAHPVNWRTDLGMFDGLFWTVAVYPRTVPYDLGRTYYESWIIGPIPRMIWRGKPVTTVEISDPELASGRGSSVSVFGEFYRGMGALGVVIGSFVLGWLGGACYSLYRHHSEKTYVAFFYCIGVALTPVVHRHGVAFMPVVLLFWALPGLTLCLAALLGRRKSGLGRRQA